MGEIAQDVETEVRESVNAMDFALKSLQFAHECLIKSGESGKGRKGAVDQKDKRGHKLR